MEAYFRTKQQLQYDDRDISHITMSKGSKAKDFRASFFTWYTFFETWPLVENVETAYFESKTKNTSHVFDQLWENSN